MSPDKQDYDIRVIRDLLETAFNVEDIRYLFSFAMHNDLRPVADELAPGDSKRAMVRKAVEYCQAHFLLNELLAEIKEANPRAYERFEKDQRLSATRAEKASPAPVTEPKDDAPTRILILAANPRDTTRLRLDEEVREIDNGLQRAKNRDAFSLTQKWAARPRDVRRAMLDEKPNIVHFCGHGEGTKGIAFEDETGRTKLVTAEALAGFFELFADRGVECVVLNACYSEAQAEAIAQHISFVVGMEGAVPDSIAIEFAVAFYDGLGAGDPIPFAFDLACNAIQWAGLPKDVKPILKHRRPSTDPVGSTRSEQYDIAGDLILQYLERKNLKRAGFERIREWIDPAYDDDFLMDVIRHNPTELHRVIMSGGKPGVARTQ